MRSETRRPSFPAPAPASHVRRVGLFATAALLALSLLTSEAQAAQPPVGLGTVDSFAVLGGSAVTNTGPSTINGDLGVSPGTSITGFPPGTVNGAVHATDAVAGQAQSDLTTAYNDAAGRTPPTAVPADLGGLTLTSGVYKSGSSLGLTGTLTLDAQGDPNSVFVFQAGSDLTTATASRVNLINGAQPCNVFWQIGSSATLGTSSGFVGTLMALTSISLNDSVTLQGRALARNGAVTLINDTITAARCATGGSRTGGGGTGDGGGDGTGVDGAGGKNGTAILTTTPRAVADKIARYGVSRSIHRAFHVSVSGLFIRQVVFSLGDRVIATDRSAPFRARVDSDGGTRTLKARVIFTDSTPAATLRLRFKASSSAQRRVDRRSPSRPPRTPGGFTG